jgi:hypothetical protein
VVNQILLYFGAFFTFAWGVAHLIVMEWIVEGVSLIFIGLLVAVVTLIDRSSTVSRVIYWVCFTELNVLSIVSLFTGFKVGFLPFKLCPVIFTGSSVLIVLGSLL